MQQTPDVPSEAPGAPFTPKFDGAGLITAIVVDADGGSVLMLAHMDTEALAKTRETGLAHFHSRSRGRLWMKGETSGNVLRVDRILVDCDQDALILVCRPVGPACHTGAPSCFYRELEGDALRPVNT
ncbi:phosphoribosyl-AMP cyclohydrolase [Tsuneonella troitsensis]|uniref:phosphoribosyl-AMP cyclohydrolase n=1 Tax=Tsuneonella troitsensis TaxID=292222 RepID=UPI00070FB2A5|nr:phosphoribosyl-AMP cyclohydrolase [Tsuneonella troitsensis]